MLKISIITVCYNSESTIESTLQSVLNQDYPSVEYIVIDGKSTDKTLNIINRYSDKITRVVSEKDQGMYFALNKGILLATGDVVGFLHADDFYTGNSVLSKVVKEFDDSAIDAVYSDLQYVDKNDASKILRNWISGKYKEGLFLKGWMPPHPTFFVKRSVYEKLGVFNTDLTSASDYELMLRFIHKHKIKTSYIPEVLVKMRVGGKSNISFQNRMKASREDRFAWKINGLTPRFYTLILKPLSKILQFIR